MSLRTRLTKALVSSTAGKALADCFAARVAIAPITSSNLRVDTLANLGADAEVRLDALEAAFNAMVAADDIVGPVL